MLKRFWLGQTPMWFNVWILGIVFFRLLLIGVMISIDALGLFTESIFTIISLIMLPFYVVWVVGIWRSAQIYKGRKLWSSLTELGVIINMGAGTFLFYYGCVYFF